MIEHEDGKELEGGAAAAAIGGAMSMVAARVRAREEAAAAPITDTDRIEFLEALNSDKRYTGRCVLRRSVTGRGWRLHETAMDGHGSAREAIDCAIRERFRGQAVAPELEKVADVLTVGPGARGKAVVDHIRKELLEIEAEPSKLSEWIDVAILALDGAWRAGHSPEAILSALVAKQAKNEARTWPDWRTADPDKAIEHVRAGDAPKADPVKLGEVKPAELKGQSLHEFFPWEVRQIVDAYPQWERVFAALDVLIFAVRRRYAEEPREELAWLVEGRGFGLPVYWSTIDGAPGGSPAFTSDPNAAIRFARKVDAERVLSTFDPARNLKAVEHMWSPARHEGDAMAEASRKAAKSGPVMVAIEAIRYILAGAERLGAKRTIAAIDDLLDAAERKAAGK